MLPPKSAGAGDAEGSSTSASATASATSTSGATGGGDPDSTSVELPPASGGEAGPTCRDAIDCRVGCALEMTPDLDGCSADCEQGMSPGEVLALLQLTECVTDKCIEQVGPCGPSSTSTGEAGTSTSEPDTSTGESDTSTSTGGSDDGSADPCLDCILANLLDEHPGGECEALAALCT